MSIKNHRNYLRLLLFLPITLLLLCCGDNEILFIRCNNPQLQYMGRINKTNDASTLYWSGSSVRIDFEGSELSATMKDENGLNYYYVITDSSKFIKLKLSKGKSTYKLATGLPAGRHTVELYKLTDIARGWTKFYGFDLPKNGKIYNAPPSPERKIEFYGNSITSGFSIEDSAGDSRDSKYENNYFSYAGLTARHYNADYHCISKSGIGFMVSWFPAIMPEIYDRLDPEDATNKWDFTQFTPAVVVVDVGQNDYWITNSPKYEQFKARFGTTPPDSAHIVLAYKSFILSIRHKYPNANIICTLGSMDATAEGCPWPSYISAAAITLNDPKIFTHFFPYEHTYGHPKLKEQREMSDSLIKFIDARIQW